MHSDWRARLAAPSCYERPKDLASAAMKTAMVAMLVGGSLFALGGCGVGTYHIPNVAPVVKQPPEAGGGSLLDDEPTETKKPEEKSEGSSSEEKK